MTGIIIVNYKMFEDTIEAVNSLKQQSYQNFKIIVIDNCSPNDSYEKLKKEYFQDEKVDIIKSEYNGGFSYGNNYGMKYALQNYKIENFLLINNDTIADENMLEEFVNYYYLNKDKKIGALCGKIYYYTTPEIIWFAGGKFQKFKAVGKHFGDEEKDLGQYDEIKEIEFATGCLIFFPSSILNKVGYLPEEYFLYYEDVDFSLSIRKHDYKIIYLPKVKIWHKIGKSTGLNNLNTNYELINRNRIILAKKHLNKFERILFYHFLFLRASFNLFRCLYKQKKIVNTYKGIKTGMRYHWEN